MITLKSIQMDPPPILDATIGIDCSVTRDERLPIKTKWGLTLTFHMPVLN